MLYSLYSFIYTIINVGGDKTSHLFYRETDKTSIDDDYVIIKRMRQKPLTESIYEHLTAPFLSFTEIDDTVYLGNAFNASDYYYLEKNGITAVVNASKEISNYFENNSDIKYFKLEDVKDINNSSIKKYFTPFIEFVEKIKKENGKILIHCFMGSSRSAVLVVLYEVYFNNKKIDDIIREITNKRGRVNINITFINELKEYLDNSSISY